ncbi:MAG: cupin domain-containing protein [Sphingobium sp.]
MHLQNFDTAAFLRDYWQKKPLLIRNPWDEWTNPLEPDELAGLACEAEVESRLVKRPRGKWALDHGPFAEDRFDALGKKRWTLLVQAVDHHVPDVAALIEPFRFVPDWRIDDVMVSYAADEGGTGPHFDQYDVFLIQGLGRRRWRVGPVCDAQTPLLPHDELRLLADFEATDEWILEPGDILYVPPRFAHDGVAVGNDCMTYSVGFRAPSRDELIAHYCDHLLEGIADDDRYADPDLAPQDNPGEIAAPALDRLHAMIADALLDRDAFARWFGQYSSAPKYAEADWRPEEPLTVAEIRALISDGAPLLRNPASRLSFVRKDGGLLLFADGQSFDCTGEEATLAEHLCARGEIEIAADLSDAALSLLAALLNQGGIAFDVED